MLFLEIIAQAWALAFGLEPAESLLAQWLSLVLRRDHPLRIQQSALRVQPARSWLRVALYRKVTCSELFPSGFMGVSRSPNFASVQSKQRAGAKSQAERTAAARPAPTLVGFPWNNGISLPNATFWGGARSCEVTIIWPDGLTQKFVKKGFCWKLRPSKVGETWGVNV